MEILGNSVEYLSNWSSWSSYLNIIFFFGNSNPSLCAAARQFQYPLASALAVLSSTNLKVFLEGLFANQLNDVQVVGQARYCW